jgi:cell division protein FtsW (lipid II flippase)
MAVEEGAWAFCVCISYTGDGDQIGCSFLWIGRGGWGGQGNWRKKNYVLLSIYLDIIV